MKDYISNTLYLLKILPLLISFLSSTAEGKETKFNNSKLDKTEVTKLAAITKAYSSNKTTSEYTEVITLPLKQVLNTKSDWHVTASHLKQENGNFFETSNVPAKLCFWSDIANQNQACFTAIDDASFSYQEVIKLSTITIQSNKEPSKGIIFVAMHRGQTLGKVFNISIWVYDNKKEIFCNILPDIRLTNQSEYNIYPSIKNVADSIFVTADRIWNSNEENLYSPHLFEIRIYKYSNRNIYEFYGKYVTKKKYLSFDDADNIDVIGPEFNNIQKYIENIL